MGHNYSSELLGTAVTIGYNLSESLFALLLSASNRAAVRQVEAGLISFIKNLIWPICCFLPTFRDECLHAYRDVRGALSYGGCILILVL